MNWGKNVGFQGLFISVNTKYLYKYANIRVPDLFHTNYIISRPGRRVGSASCGLVYYSSGVAMPFLGKALICQSGVVKTALLLPLLFRHLHDFACSSGTLSDQINLFARLSHNLDAEPC
jgi:hypothetical protein